MHRKQTIGIFCICLVAGGLAGWGIVVYVQDHVPLVVKDIPDPFLFNNGSRVASLADWQARRGEMLELIQAIEYGHVPGRPDALRVVEVSCEVFADQTSLRVLNFTVISSNVTPLVQFNFTVWLFTPNTTGPFPAVVKVARDGSGSQVAANRTLMQRGYLYACFKHTDLDPDTEGYDVTGPAQAAYPAFDWGAIGVWAWGAMRVADYLLREPWVDSGEFPNVDRHRLIVTGHSRRGKTALLAAALDERFSMTVPSGSGCGGAGSFLVQGLGSETLAQIASPSRYLSWFQPDFYGYSGREKDLPFDQHFLRALIAPRHVLSLNGLADLWANPIGTQAMYEAAAPVFSYLGAAEHNAIRFRAGGHSYLIEDFNAMLDFADKLLAGKEVAGDFYMRPFDVAFPIHYTAPGSK